MTEELLFAMYKDTPLESSKQFKAKIKKYNVGDPSEIYRRIVNYQIKKYGGGLNSSIRESNEDVKRKCWNANRRRYRRRHHDDMSEQIYKRRK